MTGLFTLSAVFLTVTGYGAPYADLGHFGMRPIQFALLLLFLPCLLLNYLGQASFILDEPAVISNPFFLMVRSGRSSL